MKYYDVIIIGGGAAGLSAAGKVVRRRKSVAILDMGDTLGRKVLASGGGRCNFTNMAAAVDRYFGKNPRFVKSAISRVSPTDILNWAKSHNIFWIEKAPGQFFCKNGASDVLNALLKDAQKAKIYTKTSIKEVSKPDDKFMVFTDQGNFSTSSLIIATGGTSFPALQVSDFGYKIAKQFGHKIIPVRPALCAISTNYFPAELSGISVKVMLTVGKEKIYDDMLFTHFGLGGPAIYRATVRNLDDFNINLLPDINAYDFLREAKKLSGKKNVATILSEKLPMRIAKWFCSESKNIADYKDSELKIIADKISNIKILAKDIKLNSLQSAEVVRGGVDTNELSSKTMESKLCPGLFFAGEVIDVAGDLGGFNLHWAWASGRIAGENA